MKTYILPLLSVLVFFSCRQPEIFEEYRNIPEEEWQIRDTVKFSADLPQKDEYDFRIGIRHTTDYEMANLWCFVMVCDSSGWLVRDSLNIKIAEPDGRWIGKGNSIKTLEYPIARLNRTLPAGKYSFAIVQGMRTRSLKGIKNVGLIVREKETNNNR